MLFVLPEVLNPILPLFYFSRFSLPCLLATAILDSFFLFFPGGSEVKAFACNVGDLGSIPGLGRSPGEGNGNHSSILAWWIPWTEEPGGLQSTGSQRVGHDWATSLHFTLGNTDILTAFKPWIWDFFSFIHGFFNFFQQCFVVFLVYGFYLFG